MGYKEQLKQIVNKINALKETIKKKKEEITKSEKYSEEYKILLIKEVKEEAKEMQEELTKEALKVIEEAKKQILSERTNVEKDINFNLNLNNTLKILEMVGADMRIEEVKTLVQPFEKDYQTMQILRHIFIKYEIKGIDKIFAKDTVDSRIEALENLSKTISHVFYGDIERIETLSIFIALNYISEV